MGATMTDRATTIRDQAIVDDIHAIMTLYPSKAADDQWIITEVCDLSGHDREDVQRVWNARFRIVGVA